MKPPDDGDVFSEHPEEDEEESTDHREWLGDFNDLEDTTIIVVEVPVRRAWILDGFLAERPEIMRVQVEAVQGEDDEED